MMYSGDENYSDEITSGFMSSEEILNAKDSETGPCNDCGVQVPKGDLLCSSCYQKQLEAEDWERLHPEARCPPRE